MRRADREVTEFSEIIDILNRCDTVRLGMSGAEYPYVVPLSFGFEVVGGTIIIYIHGAKEGQKHDLLARDSRICVEASIFHRFAEIPARKALTTEYESIIGFGKAEIAEGDGAVHGLNLICAHAGFPDYAYDKSALKHTRVYKIRLETITGKKRFLT